MDLGDDDARAEQVGEWIEQKWGPRSIANPHVPFVFFFQKKTLTTQSSLGPAYSPVLEDIHFYVMDNMTSKNAEQTLQGARKRKAPTHRELYTV